MANSVELQKPTDLDLHCLQRQDIAGFSMTRVNINLHLSLIMADPLIVRLSISTSCVYM